MRPTMVRGWNGIGALGPLLGLVFVVAFFAVAELGREYLHWRQNPAAASGSFWAEFESRFCTARNARTILAQTVTVAVAAIGMTLVIIAGGIDLSAGTALSLAATVLAFGLEANWPTAAAVALCLLTGCLAGVANGVLVALLRIVPFIVTLGTMTFFLGLAKLIAAETTIRPPLERVPAWMTALVAPRPNPEWLLVPGGVWLALALASGMGVLLRWTPFGRHAIAIGSNETAAHLCGVPLARVKIGVYSIAGLCVGLAGLLQFARLSSGNPTSGQGVELRIIAAVVVGGTSLKGGRGSIVGTLLGAAIMAVIGSGCTLLELNNPLQDMVIGIVIVAAVLLDRVRG